MTRPFAAVFSLLVVLAVPVLLSAKGNTTKITVKGGDLTTPIEITNPEILQHFNVWVTITTTPWSDRR